MIALHPLPRSAIDRVQHLILPAGQEPYVGTIAEMAEEPDMLQEFHIAEREGEAVAFFKIDRNFSRRIDRLPKHSIGFRGLLAGGQYQRQGIGVALLTRLPRYLAGAYPEATAVWLSVDSDNTTALMLYQRHGWVRDGPDFAGRCGREIIMQLRLGKAG